MKYTKKQITNAFISWNTDVRINPSLIKSDKEVANTDVEELSKAQAEDLIDYINKQ
tara:strand:- start:22534 stop:22701 length:168 start_codon:yes stop_codon:yes gene_type:complete